MSRSPALLGKRILTATSLALLTALPVAANALALPTLPLLVRVVRHSSG